MTRQTLQEEAELLKASQAYGREVALLTDYFEQRFNLSPLEAIWFSTMFIKKIPGMINDNPGMEEALRDGASMVKQVLKDKEVFSERN